MTLRFSTSNQPDIQITTLTADPAATEIITCCVCGIQRDRAVANEWREITIEGQPRHACPAEFPNVYKDRQQFKLAMQFAILCAINDNLLALGERPFQEAEAWRQRIREARQRC